MITLDNYEEYLMMHADGELQPQEEQALQAFLDEYPHLKSELVAYSLTRSVPEMEVVFADKQSLMQPEPKKTIALLPGWRTLAAAAGLIAVIFTSVWILKDNNIVTTQSEIAQINKDTTKTIQENGSNNGALTIAATTTDATVKQEVNAPKQPEIAATIKGEQKTEAKRYHVAAPKAIVNQVNGTQQPENQLVAQNTKIQLDHLPTPELTILQTEHHGITAPQAVTLSLAQIPADNVIEPNPPSWIDRLPMGDMNKEKLALATQALASGIDHVTTLKEQIREKSISIKIQQRKLILSF